MKLKHGLYGLAQSPALWYGTTGTTLLGIGFTPTASDPCVNTYGYDDTLAILIFCVDDILLSGADYRVAQRVKNAFMDRLAMTDMDEVSLILGMSVCRDYDNITLTISQADYLQSVLKRFGKLQCNRVNTVSNYLTSSRRKSYWERRTSSYTRQWKGRYSASQRLKAKTSATQSIHSQGHAVSPQRLISPPHNICFDA